ncbi:MAG: mandelate racemase/muconate lactonizing enzyme family protein [Geminicoccaceae bacterium]|nr:mandelate racemase/muconate lactonizing enzyme family protein [Geminicoccaceae bacterium]
MRITKIETLRVDSVGNMLWLGVSTDAGITGLGEAFRNAGATEAYIHETLAPWLLGKDPLEINAHREAIGRRIGNRFMGTPSRSIEIRGNAAVDLALWDILGKRLNVPIAQLFGGRVREEIRVYNTCAGPAYNTSPTVGWVSRLAEPGAAPLAPLDDLQAQLDDPGGLARSLMAEGITAMKIWPLDRFAAKSGGSEITAADLDAALAPVRAIRDAVGDAMDIMIECHGMWRLPAAVRIARALEPFGIFWLEDPIEMHRLDDLARLKQATSLAIAGSENHGTAHWYAEAFGRGLVDYAHFDIGWMGGLSEALDVAALARAHDRCIAPHDCVGPVMLAANMQLVFSQPHALVLETVRAYLRGFYAEVMQPAPVIEAGMARPLDGPGLGIELAPELWTRPDSRSRSSTL